MYSNMVQALKGLYDIDMLAENYISFCDKSCQNPIVTKILFRSATNRGMVGINIYVLFTVSTETQDSNSGDPHDMDDIQTKHILTAKKRNFHRMY